ncbi:MAG: hypothetical protein U0V72_15610 [Cytophagales bacterium]
MKNTRIFSFTLLGLLAALASCKMTQPMFAGSAYAGFGLLALCLVLLVIILKKFI